MALATAAGLVAATLLVGNRWAGVPETAVSRPALAVGLSAALMFLVGLVDDIVKLRAQSKFLFQLLAGVILVSLGAVLPLTTWYVANVVVTLFWFVALTNAFNLLDGLDGVAAGVGAVASFFLGLTFAKQGHWLHASLAWSLTGATLGFLRYNFHPASIFMGDAGSLFLGSVLAGLVVSSPTGASTSLVSVIFVPLAIVAVPLVDTTLVTVTRLLAGRPISQGGLDHSTYRLIALGLSQGQVAVLLYAFALVGGLVAMFLMRLDRGLGILLGTGFLVAMSLCAAYLGRMQIAHSGEEARKAKAGTLLVRNLVYKRRLGELLLDVVVIALAYYGAYRLRFDDVLPAPYVEAFQSTVGLVIAAKVVAFGLLGVYRGDWKYAGMVDLYRIVGGIIVADVGLFAYGHWRVGPLAESHSIVYIDALLCAALVLSSRLSFRSLELVRNWVLRKGQRVLIYGAGDQGELSLRRLVNSRDLDLHPVCFLDDDVRKQGTHIHGVPVVGGLESLAYAVDRYRINKIAIGTTKLSPEALTAIHAFAEGLGLEVAEVGFGVRWIPPRAKGDPRAEAPARPEVRSA
jgi:UDP-GlcNAc:undecaprenyl-phosphate GlcNAc-1-phosphate transferase